MIHTLITVSFMAIGALLALCMFFMCVVAVGMAGYCVILTLIVDPIYWLCNRKHLKAWEDLMDIQCESDFF